MRIKQDKHERKGNIEIASLATKEQANLTMNIL